MGTNPKTVHGANHIILLTFLTVCCKLDRFTIVYKFILCTEAVKLTVSLVENILFWLSGAKGSVFVIILHYYPSLAFQMFVICS
jgi:hypothetical protein